MADKIPDSPFVHPLYIEHANKSIPNLIDTLTLESEFDCLSLVLKHFRKKPLGRPLLGIYPEDLEDVKARCIFKLDIEEVQMLIKKLEEYVDIYNEYNKFSFIVGEHTSLEPWEYDVDCDIKPEYTPLSYRENVTKPRGPITVDGVQYNSIEEAPIDKLIRMVKEELDSLDIPYTEKSNKEGEN